MGQELSKEEVEQQWPVALCRGSASKVATCLPAVHRHLGGMAWRSKAHPHQSALHLVHTKPGTGEDRVLQVVRMLLRERADPHAMDANGCTPLHSLAGKTHSAQAIQALLDAGARATDRCKLGRTPLHYAALRSATTDGKPVTALLRCCPFGDALVNATDNQGKTALELALHGTAHKPSLCALVNKGAKMDSQLVHRVAVALLGEAAASPVGRAEALSAAAKSGSTAAVRVLVAAGAPVDAPNARGWTALLEAAGLGQTAVVELLLGLGANMTVLSSSSAPIMVAAFNGKPGAVETIRTLVRAGAKVGMVRASDGATALHDAAQAGHTVVIEALLKLGASVHATTNQGETPLHKAAASGHQAAARALVEAGAKMDNQLGRKVAALLLGGAVASPAGCAEAFTSAARRGDTATARMLVAAGAPVDAPNARGWTALHEAVSHGSTAEVKLLLNAGASLMVLADGNSPLHLAAQSSRPESVNTARALMQAGAQVGSGRLSDGCTPLHCAAQAGHTAMLNALLMRGAPVDATTAAGETALHQAAASGHEAAVRALVRGGAQVDMLAADGTGTALQKAVAAGHTAVVKALAQLGAAANPVGGRCTTLHEAAARGNEDMVHTLVQEGLQLDTLASDGSGTALHRAVAAGYAAVVRSLLQLGASVNAAGEQGTPLHEAAAHGDVDIVTMLVQAGAQLDALAVDGSGAPLHRAAAAGQTAVAAALIAAGSPLDQRSGSGLTPLYLAAHNVQPEIVHALVDAGADPLLPVGDEGERELCWHRLCRSADFSSEEHGALAEALLHITLRATVRRLHTVSSARGSSLSGSATAWEALHEGRSWLTWVEDNLLGSTTLLHRAVLLGDAELVATLAAASDMVTQRSGGVLGGLANRLTPLELAVDAYSCLPVCLPLITPLLGNPDVQFELSSGTRVPTTPASAANVYSGMTPLMLAVARRDATVVEALLAHGSLAQELHGAPFRQAILQPILPRYGSGYTVAEALVRRGAVVTERLLSLAAVAADPGVAVQLARLGFDGSKAEELGKALTELSAAVKELAAANKAGAGGKEGKAGKEGKKKELNIVDANLKKLAKLPAGLAGDFISNVLYGVLQQAVQAKAAAMSPLLLSLF